MSRFRRHTRSPQGASAGPRRRSGQRKPRREGWLDGELLLAVLAATLLGLLFALLPTRVSAGNPPPAVSHGFPSKIGN